jgi:hypothetical protein
MKIGDRVKVIGPSISGQTGDIGHEFVICQENKGVFYTNGKEYNYPESSLQLIKRHDLLPTHIATDREDSKYGEVLEQLSNIKNQLEYCKNRLDTQAYRISQLEERQRTE